MKHRQPGDDAARPPARRAGAVRHEEEAIAGKTWIDADYGTVRRVVDERTVREDHPTAVEDVVHERAPVAEGDSGEIELLPDGSVSIPLFEEELVITRRVVLRERVVIRKDQITEWQTVEATLRRERVEVDVDD